MWGVGREGGWLCVQGPYGPALFQEDRRTKLTDKEPKSPKTNQTDHIDHSLA